MQDKFDEMKQDFEGTRLKLEQDFEEKTERETAEKTKAQET